MNCRTQPLFDACTQIHPRKIHRSHMRRSLYSYSSDSEHDFMYSDEIHSTYMCFHVKIHLTQNPFDQITYNCVENQVGKWELLLERRLYFQLSEDILLGMFCKKEVMKWLLNFQFLSNWACTYSLVLASNQAKLE